MEVCWPPTCVQWLPRGRPSSMYTAMNISLSVALPLIERGYWSIPSGILTAARME